MFYYHDIPRIGKLLGVIGGQIKQDAFILDHVLYAEGKPDFSDPGRLRIFRNSETWGGYDMDAWFRVEFTVPEQMAGRPIRLELFTDREGRWEAVNPQLLVYVDGRIVQGMDTHHREVKITDGAPAGQKITVDFDAWSGMVHEDQTWSGDENAPCHFKVQAFCPDLRAEKLFYDLRVPYDTASLLPKDNPDRLMITRSLVEAVNLLDLRELPSKAFSQSVEAAIAYLETEFYQKVCGKAELPVCYAIGHTHIDVAWQWTFAHTRRKAARSFATALALMDEYPDYMFMSSQPQLYQYVKEDHPEEYERIRERIREGRWCADGGMWLEADCNLTSGESLVRQFIYGKRFMMEEFGVDSRLLWLPDVFGYSAALPQICKKAGVDYFMTTKINWNDTNPLPYDTFNWVGIDGSSILSHFIPATGYDQHYPEGDWRTSWGSTYNAMFCPDEVMGGWKRYSSKDVTSDYLEAYGYGDGGGGTTRWMVENHMRMKRGIPSCPRTESISPIGFFEHLDEETRDNPRLPAWHGELYFEYHRGTYTSIAKNKRKNRKSEYALMRAESASVMAKALGLKDSCPNDTLRRLWTKTLTNQFHDIIPGSSIKEVYDDTDVIYKEILDTAHGIADEALQAIADATAAAGRKVVVSNSLGYTRSGFVTLPAGLDAAALRAGDGSAVAVQKTADGGAIFYAENVPAMGYATFTVSDADERFAPCAKMEGRTITNGVLTLTFDEKGHLSSIFDIENDRELVPEGKRANVIETYEDIPHQFDAWDLNRYYREHRWEVDDLVSFELAENGANRAVVRLCYRYLSSTIRQDVVLYKMSRRVDFVTEIDWKETHIHVKAAFPVDIFAEKASFDIQFGNVERPTHCSNSWDFAKFETCAHKWADVSEDGYGMSMMNDCKYGHDVHDGVMRLSLLKSATFPNIDADREVHNFTYSIYPHAEGWKQANTHRVAYDLNTPLTGVVTDKAGALASAASFAAAEYGNIVLDVLKPAEDGAGVVIRAYEIHGRRTRAKIALSLEGEAFETDLLERAIAPAAYADGVLSTVFKPYEIKTFLIK